MRYVQYNSSGDPLNWSMGMALFVVSFYIRNIIVEKKRC